MICLLLIMTTIFVNGIASAEQKVKHSAIGLREEEMNAKTKAWLLMVESGKVDEEELRRITPKSIFIAPLLTGREEKCKEGYRYDHLGQCVKVIKIDPKVQLELLLKHLSTMYTKKKEEYKEEPHEVSNEPLHFSIPISNKEENEKKTENEQKETKSDPQLFSSSNTQNSPELIPIPLPMIRFNQTIENNETTPTPKETNPTTTQTTQTKDIESSGLEPLNDTEPYVTAQFEGSGVSSGDAPQEQDYTSTVSLMSEETDYIDVAETETTTEVPSTIETTTELFPHTFTPSPDTITTESYQSITNLPSVNDSVVDLLNETVKSPEIIENKSHSDIISFPSENDEVRTYHKVQEDSGYIRFPDDPPRNPSYQAPPEVPQWNPQIQINPSVIPEQQYWWLPDSWKVEETHPKSPLLKFWSRLPLIHDVNFSNDYKNGYNKAIPQNQQNPQVYTSHRNNDYVVTFNHHQPPTRVGKPFRNNRFPEIVPTPRQPFRIQI